MSPELGIPSRDSVIPLTAKLMLLGQSAHRVARALTQQQQQQQQQGRQPASAGSSASAAQKMIRPPDLCLSALTKQLVCDRLPYLSVSFLAVELGRMLRKPEEAAGVIVSQVDTFWQRAAERSSSPWHAVVRRTTLGFLVDAVRRGNAQEVRQALGHWLGSDSPASAGGAAGTSNSLSRQTMLHIADEHVIVGAVVDAYVAGQRAAPSSTRHGTSYAPLPPPPSEHPTRVFL